MKKVIWTPVAKESLEQTEEFLAELWSDKVVEEFLDKLDYRIEQIKQNPELSPTFQQSEFRRLSNTQNGFSFLQESAKVY